MGVPGTGREEVDGTGFEMREESWSYWADHWPWLDSKKIVVRRMRRSYEAPRTLPEKPFGELGAKATRKRRRDSTTAIN